jgi:glutaredoxin
VTEIVAELYTTSTCPECERIARILGTLNIPFTKRVIDQDPEAHVDSLMLGITTVPAVVINGNIVHVAAGEPPSMVEQLITRVLGA